MEMDVLAADPYITAEQAENHGVVLVEMSELLERSDVISVHVPLSRSTKNLIGREALARMKPGAILLNVARGGVVDEAAVADALREGSWPAPGSMSSSRSRRPARRCSTPRTRS